MDEKPLMEASWEQDKVMACDRSGCEDERCESQDGKLFLQYHDFLVLTFFITDLRKIIQDLRAENIQFREYLTNVFESK